MRKETVNRIDQLEKAIYGLRGMNHRDTIRESDKQRNLDNILTYTNEVFYKIEDELHNTNRPIQYDKIYWLGYELVTN